MNHVQVSEKSHEIVEIYNNKVVEEAKTLQDVIASVDYGDVSDEQFAEIFHVKTRLYNTAGQMDSLLMSQTGGVRPSRKSPVLPLYKEPGQLFGRGAARTIMTFALAGTALFEYRNLHFNADQEPDPDKSLANSMLEAGGWQLHHVIRHLKKNQLCQDEVLRLLAAKAAAVRGVGGVATRGLLDRAAADIQLYQSINTQSDDRQVGGDCLPRSAFDSPAAARANLIRVIADEATNGATYHGA